MAESSCQQSEVFEMTAPLLPTILAEGHSWIMLDHQDRVLSFLLANDFNSNLPGHLQSHILAFKNHRDFGVMEAIVEDLEEQYRASLADMQSGHTLRTIIGGTHPRYQGLGLMALVTKMLIAHGTLLRYSSLIGVTTNFRTLSIAKSNGAEVPFEVHYEDHLPTNPLFRRCIEKGHTKASLVVAPLRKNIFNSNEE